MWSILMTRTIHSTKVVRALSTGVIEFLHHPASLVRLSPILLDIVPDERDEDAYIVTERLVILGFYKTQTTFRCTFTKRADGLDCVVRAGLWTTLRTKWRVNCADDEGACLVTEEAEVEGIACFMPFIMGTATKSHHETMERLATKLET